MGSAFARHKQLTDIRGHIKSHKHNDVRILCQCEVSVCNRRKECVEKIRCVELRQMLVLLGGTCHLRLRVIDNLMPSAFARARIVGLRNPRHPLSRENESAWQPGMDLKFVSRAATTYASGMTRVMNS